MMFRRTLWVHGFRGNSAEMGCLTSRTTVEHPEAARRPTMNLEEGWVAAVHQESVGMLARPSVRDRRAVPLVRGPGEERRPAGRPKFRRLFLPCRLCVCYGTSGILVRPNGRRAASGRSRTRAATTARCERGRRSRTRTTCWTRLTSGRDTWTQRWGCGGRSVPHSLGLRLHRDGGNGKSRRC